MRPTVRVQEAEDADLVPSHQRGLDATSPRRCSNHHATAPETLLAFPSLPLKLASWATNTRKCAEPGGKAQAGGCVP